MILNDYDLTCFDTELAGMGIVLSDDQKDRFIKYYELLTEWNQKINLTAITAFDDVIRKHFLDSLYFLNLPGLSRSGKMIDVGTGAGFPGIPIAIVCPDMRITLLDSLRKRTDFLALCRDELSLGNMEPVHTRAEDGARDPFHREKYDFAVSRAVASLPVLCEYCIPFVKKGGAFISYKSLKADQEVKDSEKAVHLLGGEIEHISHLKLAGTDEERNLIVIRKTGDTPKKYPRKSGMPSKKPII